MVKTMIQDSVQYRCIGKGFCGSVWTIEDNCGNEECAVIKREDGGPGRSITNDYNMHLRVLQSALQHHPSEPLLIPQCHELVQASDEWWTSNLHLFPKGYSACRALISERIPKIPRPISNKIVDLFCASNVLLSDFVKNNVDDDACLVRPYLGRRRRHRQGAENTSRFQRFSLRNVPLHINQMEILGLDTKSYAQTMADALALMHWGAQIDANDVEFVLAPPRSAELPGVKHPHEAEPLSPPVFQSEYLGPHCMWILDFDCCRALSVDEEGVEQACVAFFKNDPFYPRPWNGECADEELWKIFKERFLITSDRILREVGEDKRFLAPKLVDRIEQIGQAKRKIA